MIIRSAAFSGLRSSAAPMIAVLLALALGGCMGAPGLADPAEEAALEADAADAPITPSGIIAVAAAPDQPLCPAVEIFEGGAAMRGRSSGAGATGVDFQASIGNVARECRFDGANMTMRIGLRGRVVLGTAGRAGSYTVPLRIAVRRAGGEVLYSNLTRVSVNVGDGIGGAPFQHVEENVVVPQAPDGEDVYEILVGVDPKGSVKSPSKKRR